MGMTGVTPTVAELTKPTKILGYEYDLFLGWMHRKLKQDSTEPLKNCVIGNPSSSCFSVHLLLDDEDYCVEATKTSKRSNFECQRSSKRAEASKNEDFSHEELFESFDFLTIGTFGMELLNTEQPPTPTLSMPSENLNSQYKEITDHDLKMISYELEKFLEAEEKENTSDTSERTSQASIITLSNMPTDEEYSDGHMHVAACPLQNYLFARSIEEAETDKELKKEKTSLKELFMRNNIVDDDAKMKCEGAELQHRIRDAARFVKKVLNRFCFSSSSSTTSSKDAPAVPVSTKKKLFKALEMFHRKVHPEETTYKQFVKRMNDKKKRWSCRNGYQKNIGAYDGCQMVAKAARKKSENSTTSPTAKGSMINGVHWIRTDSDYLILELEHGGRKTPTAKGGGPVV